MPAKGMGKKQLAAAASKLSAMGKQVKTAITSAGSKIHIIKRKKILEEIGDEEVEEDSEDVPAAEELESGGERQISARQKNKITQHEESSSDDDTVTQKPPTRKKKPSTQQKNKTTEREESSSDDDTVTQKPPTQKKKPSTQQNSKNEKNKMIPTVSFTYYIPDENHTFHNLHKKTGSIAVESIKNRGFNTENVGFISF
jgi:hypothetical protein